jgi:hypothetical protein
MEVARECAIVTIVSKLDIDAAKNWCLYGQNGDRIAAF